MRFVALLDGSEGAYGVVFPDAPGCTAMGETVDEAMRNAAEALEEWVADYVAAGRAAPEPTPAGKVRRQKDSREALANGAILALVPLVLNEGRSVRANVSFDAGLLLAIDEAANNNGLTRSSFLATAAREKISRGR